MDPILLHFLAAVGYLAISVASWRTCRKETSPSRWLFPAYLGAVSLHALAVWSLLFGVPSGIRLGVAPVLSLTLWLAGAMLAGAMRSSQGYWAPLIHAPVAGAVSLLAALIPVSDSPVVAAGAPLLVVHLVVALLGYSLFSVIAVHAFLMTLLDQALHNHRFFRWLERLPPLMTLERQLFKLIALGFVALTLTNVTGFLFATWRWDHKTVFSVSAWVVFLLLLIGRWRYGWRGQVALRWLWAGIFLLALAYVGFHFVRDFLLAHPR